MDGCCFLIVIFVLSFLAGVGLTIWAGFEFGGGLLFLAAVLGFILYGIWMN